MKTTVLIATEVDIAEIHLMLPVHYEEQQIPYDFPLRHGDIWEATVDVDTGKIENWPRGKSGDLYLKVVDNGLYTLYDRLGQQIARYDGYVPHSVIPGDYGDYVSLKIDAEGVITNWPLQPSFDVFFG